ncbi:MAG: hypothetical protein JST67_08455 [Bacteroidetes bacterium]|nr:hypothetical protein [Bacteroidota bacterium]
MKIPFLNELSLDNNTGLVRLSHEHICSDFPKRTMQFKQLVKADYYLSAAKKAYFLNEFEKWLLHKKHIWQAVGDVKKLVEYDRAWAMRCQFNNQTFLGIAETISWNKNRILGLMPSDKNPSFAGQMKKIQHLFDFCDSEITLRDIYP